MNQFFGDKIFHIAIVGTDLDEMVDNMLASGAGPFYYARNLALNARYRGERSDLVISVAFGCIGDLLIELLVQDNDNPSSFSEYLDRRPEGGLHHIAHVVPDIEASLAQASAAGFEFTPVQEFVADENKLTEIYMEPKGKAGVTLTQLVLPSAWDPIFDGIVETTKTWDGKNPKRNIFDFLPETLKEALAEGHTA
jgi:4-hydroxyphenylpyruvate dioxygenase-like putative hemolysin